LLIDPVPPVSKVVGELRVTQLIVILVVELASVGADKFAQGTSWRLVPLELD